MHFTCCTKANGAVPITTGIVRISCTVPYDKCSGTTRRQGRCVPTTVECEKRCGFGASECETECRKSSTCSCGTLAICLRSRGSTCKEHTVRHGTPLNVLDTVRNSTVPEVQYRRRTNRVESCGKRALHGARTARPVSRGIKQNRAMAEKSFLRVGINRNWCVPHGRGGIQRSSWRGTSRSLGGGFQHLHLHASAGPRTSPRESLRSAQDVGRVPSGRMCRRTFVYMTARAPKRSTHGIPETPGARAEERSIKHAKYACAAAAAAAVSSFPVPAGAGKTMSASPVSCFASQRNNDGRKQGNVWRRIIAGCKILHPKCCTVGTVSSCTVVKETSRQLPVWYRTTTGKNSG